MPEKCVTIDGFKSMYLVDVLHDFSTGISGENSFSLLKLQSVSCYYFNYENNFSSLNREIND